MKGLSVEARVGLLILLAVGLLAAFLAVLGGVDLGAKYSLYADFDNPGNIKPGAPVNVGSIRIGSVDEVIYMGGRFDEATGRRPLIRLHLRLDREVQDTIHEDALFYVTSQSVLGEQLVSIDPGDPERAPLEEGAVVEGVDPPRLDLALALIYELLEGTTRFLRERRTQLRGLLDHITNVLAELDETLSENDERIDRIIAKVETAMDETNTLLANANATLDGPAVRRSLRNLDRVLASAERDLDPILTEVRSLVNEADQAFGPEQRENVQQILAEGAAIAVEARGAMGEARGLLDHVTEGRGTVGALLMDEEIYDDIQELLRDLKHNPWKLFWRE